MASKALTDAVTQVGDTWDFACPVLVGTPGACGFTSTGWPTKKVAFARAEQHVAEHKGEGTTPELYEFRRDQGLAEDGTETVRVEDL